MADRHVPVLSPPYSRSMHVLAGHSSLQNFLDSRLCFICVSGLRVVRAQCGHLLGCRHCTQRLRDCPFCRQRIHFTYDIGRARVRNSSTSSATTISASLFSSESAKSCPPCLSYQDTAPLMRSPGHTGDPAASTTQNTHAWQDSVVQCYVCHTQWPDLLQWKEHLSQGLHRRAQLLEQQPQQGAPFLEYCMECDFYFHDPRSWSLHFGLHFPSSPESDELINGEGAGREGARALFLLSTTAAPDLHSGIQAEQVTCGVCQTPLVGLAQVLDHIATPAHLNLKLSDVLARDTFHCPFCRYYLNGLSQWEHHVRLPRHRRRRAEARALWTSVGLLDAHREAAPLVPRA